MFALSIVDYRRLIQYRRNVKQSLTSETIPSTPLIINSPTFATPVSAFHQGILRSIRKFKPSANIDDYDPTIAFGSYG